MEQTQCSETSAIKYHTQGNNPNVCMQQGTKGLVALVGM
jgi:hypothetical protein